MTHARNSVSNRRLHRETASLRILGWMCLVVGCASALSGCCSPPAAADVMVLNASDQPIFLQVVSSPSEGKQDTSDPVEIKPKSLGIGVGHAGPATVIVRDADNKELLSREVTLRLDKTSFISSPDEPCAAVADYTPQYDPEASGEVRIVTTTSRDEVGAFARHNVWLLLAPADTMPEDIVEGTIIHRVLPVPCRLVKTPKKLATHMSFLK